MKNKFLDNIKNESLFSKKDKLIVAISGGADSVALVNLLHRLNFNFQMAHCNFNLRGEESDKDENFVRDLSKNISVPLHVKHFNTDKFAKENKMSIQMAARELRYNWFEELRIKTNSDYIVVAHHKDDDVETFFINLIRGSGIRGFLGMHKKKNNIVRPLLDFRRIEIESYLKEQNQEYRTDSSNADIKYLRNNIRKHLVPLIQDMNPSFDRTFSNEIKYLNEVFEVFENRIENIKSNIFSESCGIIKINKEKLDSYQEKNVVLREILIPYSFKETDKIMDSIYSESGKIFYSETHKLLIDRIEILITEKKDSEVFSVEIKEETNQITTPLMLKFSTLKSTEISNKKAIATLDFDKLQFPLVLRKWEVGDYFLPLGMRGKKKLSDFFIDEKFSRFEKEECYLITSNSEIVWIVGHRISETFKITDETKKLYIAELL